MRGGSPAQAITRVTLVDRSAPPADLMADSRVRAVEGDLNAIIGEHLELVRTSS